MAYNDNDFTLRPLQGDECRVAFDVSQEDYQAPTTMLDAMMHRLNSAPHLFLGSFAGSKLVCYVTASQTDTEGFTEDCITSHKSGGETVILHRIWVHKDYRKKGLARRLFQKFQASILRLSPQPRRICLASALYHVKFFSKLGFTPSTRQTFLVPFYQDNVVHQQMDFSLDNEEKVAA